MGMIIISNSAFIGIDVEYVTIHSTLATPAVFYIIAYLYMFVFHGSRLPLRVGRILLFVRVFRTLVMSIICTCGGS